MGSKQDILSENRVLEREKAIATGPKLLSHLTVSAIGALFVVVLLQFSLGTLRGWTSDFMLRTRVWTRPDPAIVLVAYDDESSLRYGRRTRLPSDEIDRVFASLAGEMPAAVAVIATIDDRYYSEPELRQIGESFRRVPESYIGYIDDENLGRTQPLALNLVGRYLPGFVSRDTYSYGADSVSRRAFVSIEGFPTVYAKIACRQRGHDSFNACFKGDRYKAVGNQDTIQTFINWRGDGYPIHSSLAVAERRFPRGTFTGKVVLMGSKLQANRNTDFILTPYNREPFQTPLLEGSAQTMATLLRDNGMWTLPKWMNWLLSLAVVLFTVNMALMLPPGRGILVMLGVAAALFGVGWISYVVFGCRLNLAHPLLATFFGYYLVIPFRLVDEYRKRWHYQEKSELMAQLETLKSNFLSLVSHDLKTPIARIQGNAELALSDASKLTERQRKGLKAILTTTDELSEYVETVLDLTRIESAKVPLQKVTKDINTIIGDVIDSKRFLAQEKRIRLETKLDPIFSFKFDEKLMRRVIANLLENAIKYSPPDTSIALTSREEGSWVRVAIEDHGAGIAPEEQEKVFLKFYRVSSDETREVKGTGLGLYLVKYFVELHQGFIELKSEPGKGSVFTVSLPV